MGKGGLLSIGYIGKQSGGVTQSMKGLCRVRVLSELPQESPGKGFLEVVIVEIAAAGLCPQHPSRLQS